LIHTSNTTRKENQTTLKKWKSDWIYMLALSHHYNQADLQLARIERDNAKRIDTILEARTMDFIS